MRKWTLTAFLGLLALLAVFAVAWAPLPMMLGEDPPSSMLLPPAPEGGDAILLGASLDRALLAAGLPNERDLVVTLRAEPLPDPGRAPVDVAVVMDVSGSMGGRGKIEYARAAARQVVDMLGPRDRFTLVTFGDRANVLWPLREIEDRERVLALIDGLREGAGTNLAEGLQVGLAELRKEGPNHVRRLILLSDGYANIGISDAPTLSNLLAREAARGITASTLGLGLDYSEDLLSALADAGGGSYHFVEDPSRLIGIVSQELSSALAVRAHNVVLDVELARGVRLAGAWGHPAPSSPDRYRLYLGDLHAGQERKLALGLRIDDPEGTRLDIATVRLSFVDLPSERATEILSPVSAPVSRDPAEVERSFDREASIFATRARAAQAAYAAARAYQAQDPSSARRALEGARALLDALPVRDAPEIQEDARAFERAEEAYLRQPAASEEGQRLVKQQKEDSRAAAR
jgi:Ca-activated chloride channel family protein